MTISGSKARAEKGKWEEEHASQESTKGNRKDAASPKA
eukprot:CAMPEP_0177586346 /NCGR_PEP_ID=MMETSP0419_2-20121207/5020_1 /TAXON_ID=582737 /ORGANISM="Tetraselmis sp., Strain GSL018" /LENGTH=37 /DNA_ID= /DNA_START= /DNA_END= /DNA_ORIENTATION=